MIRQYDPNQKIKDNQLNKNKRLGFFQAIQYFERTHIIKGSGKIVNKVVGQIEYKSRFFRQFVK